MWHTPKQVHPPQPAVTALHLVPSTKLAATTLLDPAPPLTTTHSVYRERVLHPLGHTAAPPQPVMLPGGIHNTKPTQGVAGKHALLVPAAVRRQPPNTSQPENDPNLCWLVPLRPHNMPILPRVSLSAGLRVARCSSYLHCCCCQQALTTSQLPHAQLPRPPMPLPLLPQLLLPSCPTTNHQPSPTRTHTCTSRLNQLKSAKPCQLGGDPHLTGC
jgi:hypothetical protein